MKQMTVTITQVRRAFEEVAKQQPGGPVVSPLDRQALIRLSGSTLVLTLMANSINQKLGADLIVKPTDREIAENLQAMLNGKPQPHVRND